MKTNQNQPQEWTKQNLAKALQTAIAVELFTIPVYLSAASSIKEESRADKDIKITIHDGKTNTKVESFSAYNVIMSVAVQEMFHLTMVCNLANALGVKPQITAPDLKNPPSCLKGLKGMPVNGNLSTLICTMLAIEVPDPKYHYPETPTKTPIEFDGPKLYQETYDSIGDLYHALAYGVQKLWDECYDVSNNRYQKVNFKSKYPKVTAVITTLNDAYNAISCITEQGEGNGSDNGFMPDDYVPAAGQQFDELDEVDHWERFNDIKQFFVGGGKIPQYEANNDEIVDTAQSRLTDTYSKVIEQLDTDFSSDKALNLRGMADTGTLATAVWKLGKMPAWNYTQTPTPWPAPPKFPHSCQGLNSCKGQGYPTDNSCAGEGACATAVNHACQYTNSCKLQGGCGYPGKSESGAPDYNPSENTCAGNGGCQSPISPKQYYNSGTHSGKTVWAVARELFKKRYTKDNPGKTLKPVGTDTDRRNKLSPTSPKSS